MNDNIENESTLTAQSPAPTSAVPPPYSYKGIEYPLFPFDRPVTVTLQNGTVHNFRQWTEQIEKQKENLMRMVVLTNPAVLNGENPYDVKTDYTRAILRYYDLMIDTVSGVALNGNDPNVPLNAQDVVDGKFNEKGQPLRVYDLIGAPIRKAAASRLYSGKIEVERLDEDVETSDQDDNFFEDDSITAAVDKAENQKPIYSLTSSRDIVILQQLGIEQLKSGLTTEPTHVIRYTFREPSGDIFSKWEMKSTRGFSTSRPKGGTKSERFYDLDVIAGIFDSLIESIEGASLNGQPIELPSVRSDQFRAAQLAQVPLPIKKLTTTQLFSELSNLGNF
jgi:hypothetical protein